VTLLINPSPAMKARLADVKAGRPPREIKPEPTLGTPPPNRSY
jgi:hypothetical protein